jgi:ferric-dicitrate binding protein FerR (iron transport regulator)
MASKTDSEKFIKFLKNEKFIEWELCPTDELDMYWQEFMKNNPEEVENIKIAEKHLLNIKLSSFKLTGEKKREAVRRLEQSLRKRNRTKWIYSIACSAAACAAAIIISLFYFQKSQNETSDTVNFIVGSELDIQDILFISGDNTTSFQENVDIEINKDNTAHIKKDNTDNIEKDSNDEKEIPIVRNAMNHLIVPYGKQSKIVLPDGTQVWLNSGSSLKFSSDYSETREIYLTGEMYIEVAPDKKRPFHVNVPDFRVKVYGTRFNVSSYTGYQPHVVLVEGSVGLQSSDKQEAILKPGEQAVLTGSGFETKKVNTSSFTSWKDGYLLFDDTPIIEVLKQIERYYNLSFNYDENVNFRGLTCTGKIILSENLENVLKTLTLLTSSKYKIEDKKIYIYLEPKPASL